MKAPAKVMGLIGGTSWESTALYYRHINQITQERYGGHHSAECVLYSLDFEPLLVAAEAGRWQEVADALSDAGRRLAAAGAGFFLLTANTAHRVAEEVQSAVGLPLLHIGQATGQALRRDGLQRVGLIGTRYVTEDGMYADWLRRHFNIEVVSPEASDRELLHGIILDELTRGLVRESSRQAVEAVIQRMRDRGLEGVVVGCTELPLLLERACSLALPCYDTTRLHAAAAVDMAAALDGP